MQFKKKSASDKEIVLINSQIQDCNVANEKYRSTIIELEHELSLVAEEFGKNYLEKINEYLKYFSQNLQLTKLNKKGSKFVYYLKISDFDVRSESDSISLKHTLSEGEKNALALSFFLARLSMKKDINNYLIIFDDPITSLDYNRRNVTLNLLTSFARKANQFILLSHDLNFIKDFSKRINEVLNLKIINDGSTSFFITHDIKIETLTGIFKDLTVLDTFVKKGEAGIYNNRDVIRCIRPCIEGLFRIKYFGLIDDSKWLGDIITMIRDSKDGEAFYKHKDNLDELEDLNDYCKQYHHSNPTYLEIPINTEELRTYCYRTLKLLSSI